MSFHPIWTGLQELQLESHTYATIKGFWQHDDGSHAIDSEKIALMHSELSEALSALRDGNMKEVEEELADCVIRIADYCEARGLSLAQGVNSVREKNRHRPVLHGRDW
jgi:NTP pyrophosphatase (non-canonical NTP hydrolase)